MAKNSGLMNGHVTMIGSKTWGTDRKVKITRGGQLVETTLRDAMLNPPDGKKSYMKLQVRPGDLEVTPRVNEAGEVEGYDVSVLVSPRVSSNGNLSGVLRLDGEVTFEVVKGETEKDNSVEKNAQAALEALLLS